MAKSASVNKRRRARRVKWLVGVVLLVCLAAVVYLNVRKKKPEQTFAAVAVQRADLVDRLAETGTIELMRTVEVKSTIAGEVRKLLVEAGEWVKSGQLIAVIDPDPNQSLQLYQKRSAVERSQVNLREQEREFDRKKSLFDTGMLPAQEFEAAQDQLTRSRNDLRLAQLELEVLEAKANLSSVALPGAGSAGAPKLDQVRVLAPIDGIVIQRGVEIGEVVASGLSSYTGGTVLFTIGDPSQMLIRGDVAEVDIGTMRVGQDVEIVVDAYPDTTYKGRVRWIAPVGERKQGSPLVTFATEIDILDKEPRLRQGMSCDIDIILARSDQAVCVPVEAVRRIEPEDAQRRGSKPRFVAYRLQGEITPDELAAAKAAVGAAADSASLGSASASATTADTASGGTASASVTTADSASGDSASGGSAPSGAATADSTRGKHPEPPKFVLSRFEEVELQVGLETSTRVEVRGGLLPGDLVAQEAEALFKAREQASAKDKDKGKDKAKSGSSQ